MHHAIALALALALQPPVTAPQPSPATAPQPSPATTPPASTTDAPPPQPAALLTASPTDAPTTSPLDVSSDPPPPSDRSARKLRVAGYATLLLGCGLLGTMGAAAITHSRTLARLDRRADALTPDQRLAPSQRLIVQRDTASARTDRNVAIGTGISAAVSLALATTFLLLARKRVHTSRLALAPTWSPSGAGLLVQLSLP